MHTPVERRRVNAGERCDSLLAVWCDSFSGRVMCDSFSSKTLRCDRTARRNGSVPGEGIVRRVDSRHRQKIDLETYVNSTSERTYHTPRVSLSLSLVLLSAVRSSYSARRGTIADAKRRVGIA